MENKKPKIFLICKIVGFSLLAVSITLIVLSFVVESEWKGHAPHPALMIPGVLLLALATGLTLRGFTLELSKIMLNNAKYIQQETKETQKDIVDTAEEISHDAVKNTARAVKEGLKDYIHCKHCGEQIDSDSTFCKHCGKEQ